MNTQQTLSKMAETALKEIAETENSSDLYFYGTDTSKEMQNISKQINNLILGSHSENISNKDN